MTRILLMRHAEAGSPPPGGSDFDRMLTDKGMRDARKMGLYLEQQDCIPDKVLGSDAPRVKDTLDCLQENWDQTPETWFAHDLYRCAPDQLWAEIRAQAEAVPCLMLINHNPDIHTLALSLIGGQGGAPPELQMSYPAAGICFFDWEKGPGRPEFRSFVAPDTL